MEDVAKKSNTFVYSAFKQGIIERSRSFEIINKTEVGKPEQNTKMLLTSVYCYPFVNFTWAILISREPNDWGEMWIQSYNMNLKLE